MCSYRLVLVAGAVALASADSFASPPSVTPRTDADLYETTVAAAVTYLQSKGQSDDGSYGSYAGTGVTSLVTTALDAVSQDVLVDEQGQSHNWRAELVAELAKRQQPDGSWTNENARWLEGDANVVAGYALLALAYCKPHVPE